MPAPQPIPSTALRPDGRREAIHPLDVKGRFIRARRVVFAILIGIYVAAPLVHIGGHPALHLDIPGRRFFLFGATFNAQDVWILLFLGATVLFALLLLTAWRGRAWCGWACPQTVFLEAFFRPIERLVDGPRAARLKRAGTPWTAARAARAVLKHALYLALSLALSHVALSLFLSAADLAAMVREGPARHPVAFVWSVAMTAALYFNFAWFREQLCVVLCPYGRLQSVLHDRDSIVIGYDARRGEPRGHLQRAGAGTAATTATTTTTAKGDCIDCKKCVWACPTGIDIRNGLQMECVACAQCIDVCDDVMLKIGRAPGLIRYASTNELGGRARRVWRPRLFLYIGISAATTGALLIALLGRTPFEANVVRTAGVPWLIEGTRVRNQVDLHLVNKNAAPARFRLSVASPIAADIRLGQSTLELASLAGARISLGVTVERKDLRPGIALDLTITDELSGAVQHRPVRLIAPGI
jgi:cytochrome c oxidase accessory protein FixG